MIHAAYLRLLGIIHELNSCRVPTGLPKQTSLTFPVNHTTFLWPISAQFQYWNCTIRTQ